MTAAIAGLSGWRVRGLIVATGIKGLLWISGPTVRSFMVAGLLDTATTIVIAASLAYLIIPLAFQLSRRLLWRVRRRLVLSYVFVGLILIVLIGTFFLLADVSGKGTSAAFYMAELKGVVLSLSQIHQSPRKLLI